MLKKIFYSFRKKLEYPNPNHVASVEILQCADTYVGQTGKMIIPTTRISICYADHWVSKNMRPKGNWSKVDKVINDDLEKNGYPKQPILKMLSENKYNVGEGLLRINNINKGGKENERR